jgi:hypothetical protein
MNIIFPVNSESTYFRTHSYMNVFPCCDVKKSLEVCAGIVDTLCICCVQSANFSNKSGAVWGLLYVCENLLQSGRFKVWNVFHLMFSEVISEIWWCLVQMLNYSSLHSLPNTKTKFIYWSRPNLHVVRLFRIHTNPKQTVKIKLRQTWWWWWGGI